MKSYFEEGYKKIMVATLLFFVTIFAFIASCLIVNSLNGGSAVSEAAIDNETESVDDSHTETNRVISDKKEVYLGGIPIGIKLSSKGVLVSGFNTIFTKEGSIMPFSNSLVNIGDVLYSVDGKPIKSIEDVVNALNAAKKDEVELIFSKINQDLILKTKIYKDIATGSRQLGLKLKDDVLGIGTLTYVDYNKHFGALGHHIVDSDTGAIKQLNEGSVYNSLIVGQTKGSYGKAGHLNGIIIEKNNIGAIEKNTSIGLYGKADDNMIKGLNKIEVASRDEVKLGNAQVFSSIIGNKPKLYDIEIIKITKQNSPSERGMIIRVLDEELISATGGIAQGMSGSPIIQNGKLIGALTHVFLNDAKKGYGVYIDWMLTN